MRRHRAVQNPDTGDPCCDQHCWSCGRWMPARWRHWCAECGHCWRWGWQLVLHTTRRDWTEMRYLRIRNVGRIHTCPCCAHDL